MTPETALYLAQLHAALGPLQAMVRAMTERDTGKLVGVSPELVAHVGRVLDAMTALGFPMMVTDGVRSTERQRALYAQGRTAPGAIVTYADGITNKSNHQPHDDGVGHAVDCCFVVAGQPSWDARLPWKAYGAAAEALGLRWGGDWQRLHDLPHIELATR
jgi:peptidoglycan L-alanyl-D-glutamate endopeptidase CwlK